MKIDFGVSVKKKKLILSFYSTTTDLESLWLVGAWGSLLLKSTARDFFFSDCSYLPALLFYGDNIVGGDGHLSLTQGSQSCSLQPLQGAKQHLQ